jgi:hypothetical protein
MPDCYNCKDLLVKQSFNKILELLKFLENFRFMLKQIDPSEFAKVINETNIIFISSNRIASKTPTLENMSSKGAVETLEDFG